MSLESQIAALVSAANSLTSQVAGKMAGIDQRMESAERQFDEFTGKDFPQRVSEARSIKIYVDTTSGDDNNTGLSSSSPVKTYRKVREISGGNNTIYDIVEVRIEGGSSLLLDTAINANSEIRIVGQGGSAGSVTTLFQGFWSGNAPGRPMQPFRAPYVEIGDSTNGSMELHTAEFKDGHSWEESAGRGSAWMNYAGSMMANISRIKLRDVKVKLHDMPLSMVYMGGSMGQYATYQIVLGANCDFAVEAAGAASVNFTNSPLMLYCYENPKIPLDIIANKLTISGNIATVSELFGNLDTLNVRSSFTI
ncbi:hypothetical protein [Vreelandella piezotolerans]|uniref:hypothetical protein n=1 Tax=Vreelandella piezotolerans TaxID=2609667 RepID=UPI0037A273E2